MVTVLTCSLSLFFRTSCVSSLLIFICVQSGGSLPIRRLKDGTLGKWAEFEGVEQSVETAEVDKKFAEFFRAKDFGSGIEEANANGFHVSGEEEKMGQQCRQVSSYIVESPSIIVMKTRYQLSYFRRG